MRLSNQLIAKLFFVSTHTVNSWRKTPTDTRRPHLSGTTLEDVEKFIQQNPKYAPRIEAFRPYHT